MHSRGRAFSLCLNNACRLLVLASLTLSVGADTRSSASFRMATEVLGGGVPQAGSTSYTLDSALDASGGPIASSGAFTLRPGYVGQLFDVTDVAIGASPNPVDEGAVTQLGLAATLDDTSILVPAPSEVNWQVMSGPLDGIDGAGLATAGIVYQNEVAVVTGSFGGLAGSGSVEVVDADTDNYTGYDADGVDDAWQVTHFGEPPNSDAGPAENPDNDPHDNLFEWLTGFDPNDGGDFLRLLLTEREPGTATLRLPKVVPGTVYTFKRSPDAGVTVPFAAFPSSSFTVPSEIEDFEVNDDDAAGPQQFYLLEVEGE